MRLSGWHQQIDDTFDVSTCQEFRILTNLYKEIITSSLSFFSNKGIGYIMVPATTGSASSPAEPGSDSSPVIISIKESTTMLMDSAQFHLEYGCRAFNDGCFYFGHSFRDEYPDERHLSQFYHIEAEIPGLLDDVKQLVEEYVKHITRTIMEHFANDLLEDPAISKRINTLLSKRDRFTSISFADACKVLVSHEGALEQCARETYRITPIGERVLLDEYGDFLWVERWPKLAVPFYQANDNNIALNADLLFGIGEVVGAGQRHLYAKDLTIALKEHSLSENDYSWYIKMKQQAPMQTSGFGMGVERYLMWLLGCTDIRDIELFPRDRYQKGII